MSMEATHWSCTAEAVMIMRTHNPDSGFCYRLLSVYVNAIILETASSLESHDCVCTPFTPTVRSSSTRVYSPRPHSLYQRPYDCYD